MSRVEWTRYSGEDIESVVAMFISAEYPEAERITPSIGDGGIDVLVKTDRTRVYQVKKFTRPLTDNQKKQVEKSVDRLVTDPRVKDLEVDEWHLVMPWDATLEAKKWLTDYVTAKGLPEPIWDGLTRCDLWASQHSNIVDYYLGGNAERIREMALSIVQGLRLKNIREEDVQSRDVSGFTDELKETVEVLNREDPFYFYGIHVEPQLKTPDREDVREALKNIKPGILLSTLMGDGRLSVQVDVYVKNRVAFELNPLKINFVTTATPGSDEATALQDFMKFGSPMELPAGSVSGSSALPGGLGGEFENAGVAVFPTSNISEGERELRLVLFDADDQQIDSLVIHRQYTTTGIPTDLGPRGMESRLTDVHGVLDVILRLDVDEQTSKMATMVHAPDGKLAVDVLPPLRFYNKMKAPNTLAAAPRFGPIPDVRDPLLERGGTSADLWYDVAEALSLIQEHTPHRLHFPNLADIEEGLIHQILRTGALLKGQTLTLSTGYVATEHDPQVSDDAETTVMLMPWRIPLQEGLVDLGHLAHAFSGSFYKRADEGPDGLYDVWSVDDGKVLVRILSEEEQKALPDIPELSGL
ncbi:hypothetical protein [Arthrobacter sp. PAMC25284]|uniref:hypothetical protein n=1 Tax=Arthrobacter sp. PAMC25284 TaxID=2861279 RepID=UPI001C625050|nr:hypothetical protein [Arthrobacter sp. PAMC25284]QYF89572.1 hypothetical protein KY499_16125 [Arthrobacter sp. PAMC25284]